MPSQIENVTAQTQYLVAGGFAHEDSYDSSKSQAKQARKLAKKQVKQLKKLYKKSAKQLKKLDKLNRKAAKAAESMACINQQVKLLSEQLSKHDSNRLPDQQASTLNSKATSLVTSSSRPVKLKNNVDILASSVSQSPQKHTISGQFKKLAKVKGLQLDWSDASSSAALFARTPLKASPCKKCPAKAGGLCKCAISKMKM